jgi:IPT/TIG domain-containing protein
LSIDKPGSDRVRLCRALMLVAVAFAAARCGSSKAPTAPQPPALRISSISPAVGSTTGGSVVVVVGTDFASDATLSVGGVAATGIIVQGTTTIRATIGARGTAGSGDVVVTSGGRTTTLANSFTFVPPSGANQPPVVSTMRSIGPRTGQPSGFADVDETIGFVATIIDAETAPSDLDYEWTGPGSFSGSGATVAWRAPSAPAPATVTLKVVERYTEGAVTHRNESTRAFVVDVHDSQKEILDMGEDFLTLFSQSNIGTNQVLHNFSTTCDKGRGRDDEKGDVDKNRADYVEDFSKFRITRRPPVTFNFGGRCTFRLRAADACAAYAVHWEVVDRRTGSRGVSDGIDHVTAVLENNRWLLCHSDFEGAETNLTTGVTRYVQW